MLHAYIIWRYGTYAGSVYLTKKRHHGVLAAWAIARIHGQYYV